MIENLFNKDKTLKIIERDHFGTMPNIQYYRHKPTNRTALHIASLEDSVNIVMYILEECPELEFTVDDGGNTPLMLASANGCWMSVYLLTKDVYLDTQNYEGINALMCAARYNRLEVFKLLIKRGARVDLLNNKNNSALDIAIKNNSVSIVKFLEDLQNDKE